MSNYHNNGMKELSVQSIRMVTDLTETTKDQLHY